MDNRHADYRRIYGPETQGGEGPVLSLCLIYSSLVAEKADTWKEKYSAEQRLRKPGSQHRQKAEEGELTVNQFGDRLIDLK